MVILNRLIKLLRVNQIILHIYEYHREKIYLLAWKDCPCIRSTKNTKEQNPEMILVKQRDEIQRSVRNCRTVEV